MTASTSTLNTLDGGLCRPAGGTVPSENRSTLPNHRITHSGGRF